MFYGFCRKYGVLMVFLVFEVFWDIVDRGEFGKEDLDRCYDLSVFMSNFFVSIFGY